MKLIPATLAFLTVIVSTPPAPGHDAGMQDYTCPLDGRKFAQMTDLSGTQFGMRLDFKPLGPMPAPWALAQCPTCKFILYKGTLTKTGVKQMKALVTSDAYRKAAKEMPTYYCLALIAEAAGAPPEAIADDYLQASWQVDTDPAKCNACLKKAYAQYTVALKTMKPENKAYRGTELATGEIERRLGMFDEAAERFRFLKNTGALEEDFARRYAAQQQALIGKKDAGIHDYLPAK